MDFIVVGQGLAGSCIAFKLMETGKSVVVIDKYDRSGASRVAAGLINPITGKRLVKADGLGAVLPVAKAFYKKLEERFGRPFFFPRDIARIFANEKEVTIFEKRSQDPTYASYLSEFLEPGHWGGGVSDPLGSFVIKQGGYVDTVGLLDCMRSELDVRDETFDYDAMEVSQGRVVYKDLVAKRLFFCEGAGIVNNPFFKHIPMELAKGEILTLKLEGNLPEDVILNQGAWLLPIGGGLYRAGATYEWDELNTEPTESARADILARIERFYPGVVSAEIVDHLAGVRPCSTDRKPFMVAHPEHPELVAINGLASKGSLLIASIVDSALEL